MVVVGKKGHQSYIGHSSGVADGEMKLGKEVQLTLLTARLGNEGVGDGRNQRSVISEKSKRVKGRPSRK